MSEISHHTEFVIEPRIIILFCSKVAAALILSGIPVEQLPEQPLEQEHNMEKVFYRSVLKRPVCNFF